MKYLSVKEISEKWGQPERTVRNYCAKGLIDGAVLEGKTWKIPEMAVSPKKIPARNTSDSPLLKRLKTEKKNHITGGIYHKIQVDLTYNSNHIEGSRLTHEQTRYIYETSTIGLDKSANVNDIMETVNHFRCIDMIITHANMELKESFIKSLHRTLKANTDDSRLDWFRVGDYKTLPNEVGGRETTPPEKVSAEMSKLLKDYNKKSNKTFEDLLDFHVRFERIHPFQDGNGRIGRLILFKECLKYGIVPFIIEDDIKMFYYRGLSKWDDENGYLTDTCLSAQDKFKEYLKYFKI